MNDARQTSPELHAAPRDGGEVEVTQARSAVRAGVWKILAISTFLAVLAMGAAWLVTTSGAIPIARP